MLGGTTSTLYMLLVYFVVVKKKKKEEDFFLVLRINISFLSHYLSAIVGEMLKLCPMNSFWDLNRRNSHYLRCIIFLADEKNNDLWKLRRCLKAFALMMHTLHLLVFHWPMHVT